MNAPVNGSGGHAPDKKVVRLNLDQAASVALKVAINEREGKPSPKWMLDVARRLGAQAS